MAGQPDSSQARTLGFVHGGLSLSNNFWLPKSNTFTENISGLSCYCLPPLYSVLFLPASVCLPGYAPGALLGAFLGLEIEALGFPQGSPAGWARALPCPPVHLHLLSSHPRTHSVECEVSPTPQEQDHLVLLWVPTPSSDCTPVGPPVTRVSHTGHLCPGNHMPSPL